MATYEVFELQSWDPTVTDETTVACVNAGGTAGGVTWGGADTGVGGDDLADP